MTRATLVTHLIPRVTPHPLPLDFDALFRAHERFLFGVAYRMTGSRADADDVVQQTFARAMESPPTRDLDVGSLRPWLLRVAMNLSRDALRRRKRQPYVSPWLPSPIETGDESSGDPTERSSERPGEAADARYDLLESVSFAFLLALEALTPKQRAVLLLCDVFGHSVREAGAALDMKEGAVKTTHHRARAAMADYDVVRTIPTRNLQQKTRESLERFLVALSQGDVAAVEAALANDVRAVSDGAGEYSAARVWVVGRQKVARFFLSVGKRAERGVRFDVRMMNGTPAVVLAFENPKPNEAPLVVQMCDVDESGSVRTLYTVLASEKLSAVRSP